MVIVLIVREKATLISFPYNTSAARTPVIILKWCKVDAPYIGLSYTGR
jgi:hypothetical protein